MSGLPYVGATPTSSTDITNKVSASMVIAGFTPNPGSVTTEVNGCVANNFSDPSSVTLTGGGSFSTRASKVYIDNQDLTFVAPSYYQTRDTLNIPLSLAGVANGVATLNASSQIPLTPTSQLPNIGTPYLRGPWGSTATFAGSTGSTPLKIADFNIGVQNIQFQPLAMIHAFIQNLTFAARPIIEFWMKDSTTTYTYGVSGSVLVGQGFGREFYQDFARVTVIPAGAPGATPTSPASWAVGTNVWITAWLYDWNGAPGVNTVSIASGGIVTAPVYLLRTAV